MTEPCPWRRRRRTLRPKTRTSTTPRLRADCSCRRPETTWFTRPSQFSTTTEEEEEEGELERWIGPLARFYRFLRNPSINQGGGTLGCTGRDTTKMFSSRPLFMSTCLWWFSFYCKVARQTMSQMITHNRWIFELIFVISVINMNLKKFLTIFVTFVVLEVTARCKKTCLLFRTNHVLGRSTFYSESFLNVPNERFPFYFFLTVIVLSCWIQLNELWTQRSYTKKMVFRIYARTLITDPPWLFKVREWIFDIYFSLSSR